MASRVTFTILDYSNEQSSFAVNGESVSSANYDAQQTEAIALSDAVEAISIGTLSKREFTSSIAFPEAGLPTSQYAQRELKWFVRYSDDVNGLKQSCEIAAPDLTLLVAGTDLMNTAAGAGAAFVTAFEAFVKSSDGNAVSVDSVQLVGRKL